MNIIYLYVFVIGLIVGSFLNVVIDRLNTGMSFGGRSKCDFTGKVLSWYELIPVFSFVFQDGKSRHSKSNLSLQYPLVELSTGFVFIIILKKFWPFVFLNPSTFLYGFIFYCLIFSILIVIFVYDFKHKIIPEWFVWAFSLLSLLNVLFFNLTFENLISGPLLALPLFLIWFLSKGRYIGFGDVKLALGIGWMMGISYGFASLLLSFWIGGILGIFILLKNYINKKRKNSEIPFAPFLILGLFISFLYNIDLNSISLFFNNLI